MNLDTANVATALVLFYALIGGILVILSALGDVDPKLTLSFNSYLESMAIAAAGLAIGRGIKAGRAGR